MTADGEKLNLRKIHLGQLRFGDGSCIGESPLRHRGQRDTVVAEGARWRAPWREEIQDYLISAVQNIKVLLRFGSYVKRSPSAMMKQVKGAMRKEIKSFPDFKGLIR